MHGQKPSSFGFYLKLFFPSTNLFAFLVRQTLTDYRKINHYRVKLFHCQVNLRFGIDPTYFSDLLHIMLLEQFRQLTQKYKSG